MGIPNTKKTVLIEEIISYSFCVLISFGISYLFYQQGNNHNYSCFPSDLPSHIKFAKNIFGNVIFEPGLHILIFALVKLLSISYESSAVLVLTGFYFLFAYFLLSIIRLELDLNLFICLILTLSLLLVVPIFIPFVNKNFYLLIGSPNIWHNPTFFAIKPFALYITYKFIAKLDPNNLYFDKTYMWLLFLLLISALFKPSFAFVFIPSLAVYGLFLMQQFKFNKQRLRLLIYLSLFVIPTLLLFILQLKFLYKWELANNSSFHPITTCFFDTINYYKVKYGGSGPILGFFRASAFMLAVALVINKSMSKHLQFCWIMFFVSYTQFAFLTDTTFDGNFSWGFSLTLSLLFIFSLIDFTKWSFNSTKHQIKYKKIKASVVVALFVWHLTTGIYYASQWFLGRPHV